MFLCVGVGVCDNVSVHMGVFVFVGVCGCVCFGVRGCVCFGVHVCICVFTEWVYFHSVETED